jgi:hypothetical protein
MFPIDDVSPAIRREMRRRAYRGIHDRIGMDRYCVMVFTGSDYEWLEGDESIWFSDLAAAEKARDRRFRFRPYRKRYPDFMVEAM